MHVKPLLAKKGCQPMSVGMFKLVALVEPVTGSIYFHKMQISTIPPIKDGRMRSREHSTKVIMWGP